MSDPRPEPTPMHASAARRRARARRLAGAAVVAGGLAAGALLLALAGSPNDGPDLAAASPSPTATAMPGASAEPTDAVEVARTGCPIPELTCDRLTLPLLSDEPDGERIEVVFGRHQANRERHGTLVIATGGPGSSGLLAAPYYLEVLPRAVLDRYDVVFFDQRGVGESSELACARAETAVPRHRDADGLPPALETAVATWVTGCLEEAGVDTGRLVGYDSWHVAADVEAYRRHLGAERLHLYGESYGTVVAQHYAARYPDRVAGLVLDAPVDTALDGPEFAIQQMRGFWQVTLDVLGACAEEPACAADLGEDPIAAWQSLLADIESGTATVEFPVSGTATEIRKLRLRDVTAAALSMMYAEYERMLFLRTLAAASRGDLIPLMKLTYLHAGLDPETLEPAAGRRPSGTALFLAVQCRSYADLERDVGTARLRDAWTSLRNEGNRYAGMLWDDLACLHGFTELGIEVERPRAPRGDFATLVLSGTTDPATPVEWAERVAAEASDGYLIRTDGGGHVTFGFGRPCPDELVIDFLLFDDLPATPRTDCSGIVIEPYLPLLGGGLDAYADVLDALVAIERHLFALPDYYFWDGAPTAGSCDHGGSLSLVWDGDEAFRLTECELLPGWSLSGDVRYAVDGTTMMSLTAPNAELDYESSPFWDVTVRGTLDGQPVEIERRVRP